MSDDQILDDDNLPEPEIEMCETTFTYKIPDDFRENTFDLGKTGTFTYRGPRYLTFEIDKETGRESGWCLTTPKELERPCPLNVERVTVDCTETENGLLCEIANDQGHDDAVEFRQTREWVSYYTAPDGYTSIEKPTEYEPRDIYDEFNITYDFDTGEFTIPIHDWGTDINTSMGWDEVKKLRNKMLKDTDGAYTDDMPDEIKNVWIEYRQKLRDLPTALAEFPPHIAAQMFPPVPDGDTMLDPEE